MVCSRFCRFEGHLTDGDQLGMEALYHVCDCQHWCYGNFLFVSIRVDHLGEAHIDSLLHATQSDSRD